MYILLYELSPFLSRMVTWSVFFFPVWWKLASQVCYLPYLSYLICLDLTPTGFWFCFFVHPFFFFNEKFPIRQRKGITLFLSSPLIATTAVPGVHVTSKDWPSPPSASPVSLAPRPSVLPHSSRQDGFTFSAPALAPIPIALHPLPKPSFSPHLLISAHNLSLMLSI